MIDLKLIPVQRQPNKDLLPLEKAIINGLINYFCDSKSGKIICGAAPEIKRIFSLSQGAYHKVRKEYLSSIKSGKLLIVSTPHKKGKVGAKPKISLARLWKLKKLNSSTGGELTIRELTLLYNNKYNANLHYTTIHRYTKKLKMRVKRFYVKPFLTDAQKYVRLDFVKSKIGKNNKFKQEKNVFHVDEKWFYLLKVKQRLRCGPDDAFHSRKTQSKRFIPKIMFLSCIGTPHEKPDGSWFDGKIGVFMFAKWGNYKRKSKHHVPGDIKLEPYAVDAAAYKDIMIKPGGVLEKIKAKCPWMKGKRVVIQQDGAKPHTAAAIREELNLYGQMDGWKILFETQPAQSPDLNKNDLSFFYSLQQQAERYREKRKNLPELCRAVEIAYNNYDARQLARIHSLQRAVYVEILKDMGGNDYRLPHTGIRKQQGDTPTFQNFVLHDDLVSRAEKEIERLRILPSVIEYVQKRDKD